MRRLAGLILIGCIAMTGLGADAPKPRPADPTPALSDQVRADLRDMLRAAAQDAKPRFRGAAVTIEEARRRADVPPEHSWQAEFAEWFVFGRPDGRGGPDPWFGILFVQKGTNRVGYYLQNW